MSDGGDHPVLLFDGVCNLCNGVVQFIIPRDPEGRIRFAPLQSAAGKALLSGHGLPPSDLDSVVLVADGEVYRKSNAVIRVAELLGWPYRAAAVGRAVPESVRDTLYDVIAANRYDVFGRKDQCMLPDDDVSDRFLD
ncbi:thiol-disulfide oxidoreductase DCC family protein [Haloarcula salinisoli]|uniref:Thiol-disulfide oxidoreductase DCC family protein n=1 Tax=Haloarcula salinisoli TaxID=2487746 RepID=A0A8J8CB08_9EURY|nr:thiol-disulfide oxidoreductase DCC family protein [Halomicroarcula salinisoli]MBX0303763.1 thiol-disulfide oxidoreductase DCC family protein [Halomicroarcula salinisoli]